MTEGFVKLYRILLDDEIWQFLKPEFKTIMITLLLMASYKEKKWIWKNKKYECRAGEFVTSLKSIKKNCGKGVSLQNIRSCLSLLQNYGFLTNESTNQNRKIYIQNWSKYQNGNKVTNKQLTSNSQATNKQLTTIKNDKNVKNDKNNINNIAPTSSKKSEPKPKIVFNFENEKWEGITDKDLELWGKAYPAAKLNIEFAKMKAWILSAGAKGKKSNWRGFITRWLNNCQDRGGTKA